jgi:hypothetical protein
MFLVKAFRTRVVHTYGNFRRFDVSGLSHFLDRYVLRSW